MEPVPAKFWTKEDAATAIIFFGYVVLFLFMFAIASAGYWVADAQWRQEMVNRGYAEFDSKTTEWRWVDE